MRARRIIQAGAFDPEDVQRLQAAFDLGWAELLPSVKPTDIEKAREMLATVVVSAGNVSGLDAEELAAVAVRSFNAIREADRTAG